MNTYNLIKNSFRRVYDTKQYVLMAYGLNIFFALMLAISISNSIEDSIGNSAVGENMLESFDPSWYSYFSSEAEGLAKTFNPSVAGIGAVFNALDKWISGDFMKGNPIVIGVALIYMLLWVFLSGGFISLYAKSKNAKPAFFQQAAANFPRFLVLGLMAGILYFLIFKFLLTWMTSTISDLTRVTTDERIVFAYTVLKYTLVWLLVFTVNIVIDYSKILLVLGKHKNMFTAPLRGSTVVFGNFGKTFGLYFSLGLLWLTIMLIYWALAPGASQSVWWTILGAFLLGQLYIFSRVWTRTLFFSGQTELCAKLVSSRRTKTKKQRK